MPCEAEQTVRRRRKPTQRAPTDENTDVHRGSGGQPPSPEIRTTRSGRRSVQPSKFWAGHYIEREADGSYAVNEETGDVKAAWGTVDYTASSRASEQAPTTAVRGRAGAGGEYAE